MGLGLVLVLGLVLGLGLVLVLGLGVDPSAETGTKPGPTLGPGAPTNC